MDKDRWEFVHGNMWLWAWWWECLMNVLPEESINSDRFTYATVVTEWIVELSHHQVNACLASVWTTMEHEKMHAFLKCWVEDSITAGLGTVNSKKKKKVKKFKSLLAFLTDHEKLIFINILHIYLSQDYISSMLVVLCVKPNVWLVGSLCRFVSLYSHFHHLFLKS